MSAVVVKRKTPIVQLIESVGLRVTGIFPEDEFEFTTKNAGGGFVQIHLPGTSKYLTYQHSSIREFAEKLLEMVGER